MKLLLLFSLVLAVACAKQGSNTGQAADTAAASTSSSSGQRAPSAGGVFDHVPLRNVPMPDHEYGPAEIKAQGYPLTDAQMQLLTGLQGDALSTVTQLNPKVFLRFKVNNTEAIVYATEGLPDTYTLILASPNASGVWSGVDIGTSHTMTPDFSASVTINITAEGIVNVKTQEFRSEGGGPSSLVQETEAGYGLVNGKWRLVAG